MSSFSPDWLALREAADLRSRNTGLADSLRARFLERDAIKVVDLGSGTGANLRATQPLLPDRQTWLLVDHDPTLLATARKELAAWADLVDVADGAQADQGQAMVLRKGTCVLSVQFRQADLATDLEAVLDSDAFDLVTASALFDLASEAYIRRFAGAVARRHQVFYTVLTYNGIQRWAPRGPNDQRMLQAFCQHQMSDKGFGVASGATAPIELAESFTAQGYNVVEGDSPWVLRSSQAGSGDAMLLADLAAGFAAAVRVTKAVAPAEIDAWLAGSRTGAEVGHTDTLAMPGASASVLSMEEDD